MHQAVSIPWGAVQVSDNGIAEMMGVYGHVNGAFQLLVGTDPAKSYPLGIGRPSLDLQ